MDDIFADSPLDNLDPLNEEQFEALPDMLEEAFDAAIEEEQMS